MNESVIVKDYHGLRFLNWWRFSLKMARTLRRDRPRPLQALKTRMAAFGPIRRPVFILGCPRSGTTYLGNVLEAMPEASYYFEPAILKYYTRLIYEKKTSLGRSRLLYQLCLRSLLLAAPGTGTRIVEKNPNHLWVAETLLEIFPDAQFIVISRDGRDTALSLLQKPWHLATSADSGKREPGGYLYGPYPHFYIETARQDEYRNTSDLHRCIWIWRRHAEQIEHLKSALPPDRQFHLNYADLIRYPDATLCGILDFIGEDRQTTRTKVLNASREGHAASIDRWKDYFGEEDLAIIEQEAGDLLARQTLCTTPGIA